MNSFFKSDIGRNRSTNQDEVVVVKKDELILAILCDGMGGPKGGQFAARTCIGVFKEEFSKFNLENETKTKDWLYKTTIKANDKILKKAKSDTSSSGMGTTLVALLITPKFDVFASVGDSRLYRYDEDKFTQLSEDQTFVAALLRAGYISNEQAKDHPRKSMLLSAVGSGESIDLDVQINTIEEKGNYFLCSDGVYNMLSDVEIFAVLSSKLKISDKGNKIVDLSNEKGGIDNIGVIILER
ncbi:TPA: serine/threonine-protein phosphatase [bacterium]|nr:serine/threonine-protein phosphatase [bacterium]